MKSNARVIDRGGAHHPLIELALARLREFVREPEALFWAFVFPILMSVALAVAFPGGGGKPAVVGIEPGAGSAAIRADAVSHARASRFATSRPARKQRALREGEVHLLIVPTDPPTYRFDPARDESRIARLLVDDALKRAAGRHGSVVRRAKSRCRSPVRAMSTGSSRASSA